MVLEASASASAGLEGLVNFSEVLSGYLKFSRDISWVLRVSQVLNGLLMCQRTSMATSGSLSFRVVLFLYFSISPQFTNVLSYSSIYPILIGSTVLYGYLSVSGFTRVFHDIGDVSTVPYRTFAKKREPWRT